MTAFVPTIVSDSEHRMLELIRVISDMRTQVHGARIAGCHLEGPFLSPEYKGADSAQASAIGRRRADLAVFERRQKLQAVHDGTAPEVKGIEALMHYIVPPRASLCSWGIPAQPMKQAMHCVRAGAASFTHLMNAMRPLDRHEPGILGAALASDVFCEFICDGLHLHPANVQLLAESQRDRPADRGIRLDHGGGLWATAHTRWHTHEGVRQGRKRGAVGRHPSRGQHADAAQSADQLYAFHQPAAGPGHHCR